MHVALETTEPTSFGYGFVSGLLSALLGMAGFGIVLSLRFPQYFGYGELRPLACWPVIGFPATAFPAPIARGSTARAPVAPQDCYGRSARLARHPGPGEVRSRRRTDR
jgi:hypothetical protein